MFFFRPPDKGVASRRRAGGLPFGAPNTRPRVLSCMARPFIPYRRQLKSNARTLRRDPTPAERKLWFEFLSAHPVRFTRQKPLGPYIADFYCHQVKLIVEVDGTIHQKNNIKETDEARQKELERWGYIIIRFTNEQVMKAIENVIKIIAEKISQLNNLHKQNTPHQAESKSPL